MTNADKIRAMTDGELAVHITVEFPCPAFSCPHMADNMTCYECVLKWLKQEVEE